MSTSRHLCDKCFQAISHRSSASICIILNANQKTKTGEAWEQGYCEFTSSVANVCSSRDKHMLPVEVFGKRSRFWCQKLCTIGWLFSSEALQLLVWSDDRYRMQSYSEWDGGITSSLKIAIDIQSTGKIIDSCSCKGLPFTKSILTRSIATGVVVQIVPPSKCPPGHSALVQDVPWTAYPRADCLLSVQNVLPSIVEDRWTVRIWSIFYISFFYKPSHKV